MLMVLHELLLSDGISARYIHLYRVSHLRAKFMKLFSHQGKEYRPHFLSAAVV